MEKTDREKTLAAREKLPLYWAAIAANLVPFALCFALFGGYAGHIPTALIFGGGMTAVGIGLTFLFRAKWEEKRIPWLFSVCCLGAAKGGCAAALYLKLSMVPSGFLQSLRVAFLAAGLAFGAAVFYALAVSIRPTAWASRVLAVLLPLASVVLAIILLACLREIFFGLLLLNLLSCALCSVLFWEMTADGAEARFLLSVVSMLYATLLFLIALFVVSDGDCCDGADCDCPRECCGDVKKKKR